MNCPICERSFEEERSMKIHHKMSHGESLAKKQTSCENCGQSFTYYPSNKPGVYCTGCVESGDVTWSNGGLSGEDHPRYGIEPEEHPMWKGGYNIKYIGKWHRIRAERLELDNHECQRCGEHKDSLGQEPDVHHIKPVRTFECEENAHTLENTVSLCRSCHSTVENAGV